METTEERRSPTTGRRWAIPDDVPLPPRLTAPQVADLLGVGKQFISTAARKGWLKPAEVITYGKKTLRLFDSDEVRRYSQTPRIAETAPRAKKQRRKP